MMTDHRSVEMGALEPRQLFSAYHVTNLVADVNGVAAHTDGQVQNAWGIVAGPDGLRTVNNGTWYSTVTTGAGVPISPSLFIPTEAAGFAAPTGLVLNDTGGFAIHHKARRAAATYIIVGEDGGVVAYNPKVFSQAIVERNDAPSGSLYKGAAVGVYKHNAFLFAADFHNNKIAVLDSSFQPGKVKGKFKDANLPAGYAPFNIQHLGDSLYVTYAKTVAGSNDEAHGPGLGIVDVFGMNGVLTKRLATGGTLDAPWGLALAPQSFGQFAGDILVGNFGNGRISAFSADGTFDGQLMNASNQPVSIDGLWGITFGNNKHGTSSSKLYFAAGPGDEEHGLIGAVSLDA